MQEYPIETLVKHRRGMSFLDKLVSYSETGAVSEAVISSDSLFLTPDGVPAWTGLEYAAQTVGALAGLRAVLNGKEPSVGLLLSCRRYKSAVPYFTVGMKLTIRVEEEFNDGRVGAYRCAIFNEWQEEIAALALSAYSPQDETT
jgi:predicted hotdog family 3-hydroxylacyl-ACP dehydratase